MRPAVLNDIKEVIPKLQTKQSHNKTPTICIKKVQVKIKKFKCVL